MKIKSFTFSFIYSLGQITTGLLLHPYQTMQSIVRGKVFIWMTLLPSFIVGFLTVFWREVFVPVVQLVFSCQSVSFLPCGWLEFVSNFLTFFCIYWQILLLYLLVRFTIVYRDN